MTPVGEFRSALIPGGFADRIHEVFAHPFTAGETIAQSRLGALRVNGVDAHAEVVSICGNGDYILRITTTEALQQPLELVA